MIVFDNLHYGKYEHCECLPPKPFCNISIRLSTSFRKLSYFQIVTASQFKLGLLFSSITQFGRNGVHDFFAASHTSRVASTNQVSRVSAIATFVIDVQNQQNHIAHEALFQRAGNSEWT